MDRKLERQRRLRQLIEDRFDGKQVDLARKLELEPSYVSRLLFPFDQPGARKIGDTLREKIETGLGLPVGWLDGLSPIVSSNIDLQFETPPSAKLLPLLVQESMVGGTSTLSITYLEAKGSCGGGNLKLEKPPNGVIEMDTFWFQRFGCNPESCIVVHADGDSMADFICDGDLVFFNTAKTTPQTGKIYLIEHPDGLRIKQYRREIDGTIVLESRNPDKRKYPDERIPPGLEELLVIVGEQFYRQG